MRNSILLAPHNDDEALFGSYTIMRDKPQVYIVYDSYVQVTRGYYFADKETRRNESIHACDILGVWPPIFLGLNDEHTDYQEVYNAIKNMKTPEDYFVFAPKHEKEGNRHHNLVALACEEIFASGNLIKYLTYTHQGKSTSDKVVSHTPQMANLKQLALACYQSQLKISDCRPHFIRSQEEYYA